MQDAHGLNVNLVLWCVWSAEFFAEPASAALKSAIAIAGAWEASIVAPLRSVRRTLKSGVAGIDAGPLRDQVKAAELAAEQSLQARLDMMARETLGPAPGPDREGRARRALAAYARAARAAETPGFSISLLEEVIRLTLDSPDQG